MLLLKLLDIHLFRRLLAFDDDLQLHVKAQGIAEALLQEALEIIQYHALLKFRIALEHRLGAVQGDGDQGIDPEIDRHIANVSHLDTILFDLLKHFRKGIHKIYTSSAGMAETRNPVCLPAPIHI